MKKKILLMVAIVAMLVCLFAISASAAEPAYNDGEWIYAADGTTKLAIRDTEGNPLVWYMNGDELKYVRADQTDETQAVYVKYSISAGGSGFDNNVYAPQKTLKDIDIFDNGTQIECSGINSALVLFNMEKLDIDALNGWLWGNKRGCCLNMRGIVFPNSLKAMGTEGFTNHKVVQVWNLENTQLVYVSLSNSNPFSNSTLTQEATDGVLKLPQTLDVPLSVSGTQIKTYIMNPFSTFNTCQKWYQLWRGCKQLEKIIVPAHFAIGFGEEAFRETPNQYIVFITGTEQNAIDMRDNTQDYCNGGFKAAKIISYETYLGDKATYDNATNQVYVVYGYNFCDAFYDGEHKDIGNDCVIQCERCDDYDGDMKENPKHNYVNAIAYANYLANGVKTQTCQNEGCVHKTTPNVVSVNPIISSFKGYSVKEDGNGITFGYTIDYNALDEYAKVSGKKVELGFVVAAQSKVTDNKLLNADGSAVNANVIKASVVSWSNIDSENEETVKYNGADFKLTGDFTGLENTAICMAGYLFDGAVAYLNANASGEASDYITYGELVAVTE